MDLLQGGRDRIAARSPSAKAPPAVPHCSRDRASPANHTRSPTASFRRSRAPVWPGGTTAQEPRDQGSWRHSVTAGTARSRKDPRPTCSARVSRTSRRAPFGPGPGRVEPGGQGHVELEIVERRPVDPRQQARRLEPAADQAASRRGRGRRGRPVQHDVLVDAGARKIRRSPRAPGPAGRGRSARPGPAPAAPSSGRDQRRRARKVPRAPRSSRTPSPAQSRAATGSRAPPAARRRGGRDRRRSRRR